MSEVVSDEGRSIQRPVAPMRAVSGKEGVVSTIRTRVVLMIDAIFVSRPFGSRQPKHRKDRCTMAPKKTNGRPGPSSKPSRNHQADMLRASVLLDDYDDDVIRFLYAVQCATTNQIHRAVLDGICETAEEAGRRLRRLSELKMLASYRVRPFVLPETGPVHQIWCLEPAGVERAQHYRIPQTDRLSLGSAKHHVATAEFAARLIEAGVISEWIREPLRWTHGDGYRHGMVPRPIFLEPDGKILLPTGLRDNTGRFRRTGWITIYVEIDMGTEKDRQIEWKFDRYSQAFNLTLECWREGEARSRFMAGAYCNRFVLFACHDESRVEAIQDMMDDQHIPGLALPYAEALRVVTELRAVARNREDQRPLGFRWK